MTATQRILVIDDEPGVCELISVTANELGIDCTTTTDAAAFLSCLTPDITLILLDLVMPGMDGIELLRLLAQQNCKAGIVLISGTGKRIIETAKELTQTLGLAILGHLHKPFRVTELEAILRLHALPATPAAISPIPETGIRDEELRRAIEQDEFILHYQPQVDVATANISGVEALVRWQHPERGLVLPDDFISRMEALGLIDRLGWMVANRAMREVTKLADRRGVVPMLSVNVSVQSLQDLKFPDKFVALAEKHGVAPINITIEITERCLIKEMSWTLDVLTRLRMKSVRLSIDDFGTGYSMMQQLRNIPATELKIDRSFVQDMLVNDTDRVVVQKTIEIGRELGLRVVAEGVERQEQFDFLRTRNCDAIQGYFFSRPLPLPQMVAWLKSDTVESALHDTCSGRRNTLSRRGN